MPKESVHTVEKLPHQALFKLKDGRVFRKEEKLRKRYKCVEVSSRRVYLFSPVAEVEHIEQKQQESTVFSLNFLFTMKI